MPGNEDAHHQSAGVPRKTYFRSVSWSGTRSPDQPSNATKRHFNSKARSALPPLKPLSVARKNVKEWPKAGSDDSGVWAHHPPTPGLGGRTESSAKQNPNQSADEVSTPMEFEFQKDKLAFFNKECSQITNHVYLGSDAVARNREVLRQKGITHVLNCVGFACPEYFKDDMVYKTLWLQDSPCEDITSILYDVFDFIEDVREKSGRVLVHCCQGVSRSTSLVIAYLMWREELSFEDAFQRVKRARGVANPNMGFACQLLQCQKRVHAVPASPNSVLKIYRMAPHSPYDPLNLVPKMLPHPGKNCLDSRGAFVVHVPSAIYVWTGKYCSSVMSNSARRAALQVVKYEKAQGSVITIQEDKEPCEFWGVLLGESIKEVVGEIGINKGGQMVGNNRFDQTTNMGVGDRKVDEYDVDFEIFQKALSGGVVPPFPLSRSGYETRVPARENGWGRLRRKFANGIMKKFLLSSKLDSDYVEDSACGSEKPDDYSSVEKQFSALPVSPETTPCISEDIPVGLHNEVEQPDCQSNCSFPSLSPTGSPDLASCDLEISPKFSSKSPSLSPSTSDYSSFFTFSPSTSNCSDSSTLSSQPSPSNLDFSPHLHNKKSSFFPTNENLQWKTTLSPLTETEAFTSENYENISKTFPSPCQVSTHPSIAERRGSHPPSLVLPVLPSMDMPPRGSRRILLRSCSFSLPDLLDDEMMGPDSYIANSEDSADNMEGDEAMLDVNSMSLSDRVNPASKDRNCSFGDDQSP